MIRYDLTCDKGHEFDGWFRDSQAYDEQSRERLVACTACGSTSIAKQLMKPGIPGKSNRKSEAPVKLMAGADPRSRALMKMMRELRQKVEANAEYVGDKFAD